MYLTVSKRFEFCASHLCRKPDWSEAENLACFGDEAKGRFGHGHNFTAYFAFHGEVEEKTGILVNFSQVKERINPLLSARYDHKFVNADTRPFDKTVPTTENLVKSLLEDAQGLFSKDTAQLVSCHLSQSRHRAATAFGNGKTEAHYFFTFSAARRTHSPALSDKENLELFGAASSPLGHGHNYLVRVTLQGTPDAETGLIVAEPKALKAISALKSMLDHKNLNAEIAELRNLPMTTETLSRFIWLKLKSSLPVSSVKLYENEDFFVECNEGKEFSMGIAGQFSSAHRLHSPSLSDKENREIYDKCNNPKGHGHEYRVEATISDELDERTGIVGNLVEVEGGLNKSLEPWSYRHLEQETGDFKKTPSTGENIVRILWERLNPMLGGKLSRLRLWETPNNRFTLRKTIQ